MDLIKARAQRDANQTGQTLAILNLNTIGAPMYVCRTYDPALQVGRWAHQFVCIIEPHKDI